MKKISFLLISAIALLFAACAESKFEMHQTYFYPQQPGGMKFYADQTYDSIKVFSYDPWTAEIQAEQPWFNITPTSCEARPGSSALTRIDISMPQNTSGKNYKGSIVVSTYDNNKISMPIYQCSWLDIQYPTETVVGDKYEDKTVTFNLPISAAEKSTTISFHVYQDGATLTSDSEWVVPGETKFKKGSHSVVLNTEQNESKSERKAMVVLTSGDISTPIHITQAGKKDKEEKENK